jgi:uncharacterized membrane protein
MTMQNQPRLHRFALITGIAAFALAAVLLIANQRTFFNWLLLGGTIGNLVAVRAFVLRSRAG